jgi:hypothetical protein
VGRRRGHVVRGAAAALAAALVVPAFAAGTPDPDLTVRLEPSADRVPVGDRVLLRVMIEELPEEPPDEVAVTLLAPPDGVVLADGTDDRCLPMPEASAEEGLPLERLTCAFDEPDPVRGGEAVVAVSVVGSGDLSFAVEDADRALLGGTVVTAEGPDCDVVGTEGDDVLFAEPGGSVVCGLGGNDILHGGPGDDTLLGGPGDDLLMASAGNDVLDGGEGRDTVSFADAPAGIRADLQSGTALGWGSDRLERIEDVVGSQHDDVLAGDAGPNRLEGLGGSDILRGRGGDDVLLGGPGSDFLHGGPGADTLDGGGGDDICLAWGGGSRTRCQTRHPRDPRDTRGPLDVARVRTALGSRAPAWSVRTYGTWRTRPLWDRGYVVIWLDTRGGPQPNHYALLRSTGGGVSGALYRVRSGRDVRMGTLRTWRPNRRGINVRIPLSRLSIGPHRAFYRWGVQTMFTGAGCRRVCFDPVPGPGRTYLQPLP